MAYEICGYQCSGIMETKDDPQIYIVDLRSREDFQVFHLRNAHCYPYDEIEHWEHKLPKIVRYCCVVSMEIQVCMQQKD